MTKRSPSPSSRQKQPLAIDIEAANRVCNDNGGENGNRGGEKASPSPRSPQKSPKLSAPLFGCANSHKRRLDKFYRQQEHLLESFANDKQHVQCFQQHRQLQQKLSETSESEFSSTSAQPQAGQISAKRLSSTASGGCPISIQEEGRDWEEENPRINEEMDGNHEKNEENCRKKDKNRGKDEENHENNGKNCGKYGENEENSKGRRKNEEDYEEEEDEFSQSLGFTSAEIASKFLLAPASPKLHVKKTLDSAAATNGQLLGRRPKPPVPVVEQDGQLLLLSPENRDCPLDGGGSTAAEAAAKKRRSSAHRLALFTLFVNFTLTLAKFVASYLSGSLSIISSLVDSLVDITSGLVIWLTSRAIKKHDPYLYPVGRTRLEPVALVIVSVIMAVASVQMIVQSLESIYHGNIDPKVDLVTIAIMLSTIAIKLGLYAVCSRFRHDSSIRVLAQDHRNDCLSNSVALMCAFCAHKFWIYLDPIGAIVVALYIALTWYRTGHEHLLKLSGRSAKPEFINRIIKVCIDYDARIQFIDTVLVYHFGSQFLVEVHIVLDENMRLKETHDISEALQNIIESLPDVERAFVHVDYEYTHKPQDEHKKA